MSQFRQSLQFFFRQTVVFFLPSYLIQKTMAVDSFFANSRKRKRPVKTTNTVQRNGKTQQPKGRPASTQQKKKVESDIEGDDDEDDHFNANQSTASEAESSDEEIVETAAEKRVRLAKAYLGTIEETLDGTHYFLYFQFAELTQPLYRRSQWLRCC